MNANHQHDEHWPEMASLYVAGVLAETDRAAFEQHLLSCHLCQNQVAAWQAIALAVKAEVTARSTQLPPLNHASLANVLPKRLASLEAPQIESLGYRPKRSLRMAIRSLGKAARATLFNPTHHVGLVSLGVLILISVATLSLLSQAAGGSSNPFAAGRSTKSPMSATGQPTAVPTAVVTVAPNVVPGTLPDATPQLVPIITINGTSGAAGTLPNCANITFVPGQLTTGNPPTLSTVTNPPTMPAVPTVEGSASSVCSLVIANASAPNLSACPATTIPGGTRSDALPTWTACIQSGLTLANPTCLNTISTTALAVPIATTEAAPSTPAPSPTPSALTPSTICVSPLPLICRLAGTPPPTAIPSGLNVNPIDCFPTGQLTLGSSICTLTLVTSVSPAATEPAATTISAIPASQCPPLSGMITITINGTATTITLPSTSPAP